MFQTVITKIEIFSRYGITVVVFVSLGFFFFSVGGGGEEFANF